MVRASLLSSLLLALLSLTGSAQSQVSGQTIDSSLQSIRTAIIQATSIPDASVDLKVTGKIFLVTRINSTLNQTRTYLKIA
jgi:hypothetical protein